jgi:HEAT repeat protein
MTGRTRARAMIRAIAAMLTAAAVCLAAAPAPAQQFAFDSVVARLQSNDPKVRLDGLKLLREAGYLQAVPAMAALLADPDDAVQSAAVDAIVAMFVVDERYTREYGQDLVREKGATLPLLAFVQGPGATIANLPPASALRGLITAAGAANVRTRFDAAYAMAVLGRPLVLQGQFPDGRAAVNRLMAILHELDPTMRLAATHALGRLMGAANRNPTANPELTSQRTEVGDQIIAGMNDGDEMIRISSMGALAEMRYERAVQSLTDVFNYYKKGPEAVAAIDAVAKIGHPGSVPFLQAQLGNRDASIRRVAIEGLARAGDRTAIAEMEARTAGDQSAFVGHARAFARARIGDYSQLGKLVDGFKFSLLESDTFDYLVDLGAPAAGELAAFSASKDAKVRAGIAEVLGIVGSQSSLGLIEMLMRDRSDLVASAAGRSQMRLVPRAGAAPRPR